MKKLYKFSEFLKNRENRIKPLEARKIGLRRIEKIDFSGNIYLSEKDTNTDMILVKKGDLVISGINVEKGALGVYQGVEDVLATIHYSSYECNYNLINIDYLKLFIKSLEFKSLIYSSTGGGIKTEIKPKDILSLKIWLPSLDEQEHLSKVVENALSLVGEFEGMQKKIISQLKQIEEIFINNLLGSWDKKNLSELIQDKPQNGYSPKGVEYITKVKSVTLSATTTGTFMVNKFKFIDI